VLGAVSAKPEKMTVDLSRYHTWVFDCDGVILDSNLLKTQAYYDTAIAFGASHEQAQAIMDYHVKLGGISRYPKYQYFLEEIMQQPATEQAMAFLLTRFASEIHQGLLGCKIADGLFELRERYPDPKWMVLSGGDQEELRRLFKERQLDHLFDAGIFGSPDNKDQVLAREKSQGNIMQPALFLGDSRYDHEAAASAGLDFIFISQWTEFLGWKEYCNSNNIEVVQSVDGLLD
jgi:phosphoglycolate phosphatase-like HAD superfamily hydrolase